MLAIFLSFIALLFLGVPVVYALVGVSLIFVLVAETFLDPFRADFKGIIEFDRTGIDYRRLAALSGRIFGKIIKNPVLVAPPMFIFMGLMLDQSGVAQRMMRSMQRQFGGLRVGLSLTVLLIYASGWFRLVLSQGGLSAGNNTRPHLSRRHSIRAASGSDITTRNVETACQSAT